MRGEGKLSPFIIMKKRERKPAKNACIVARAAISPKGEVRVGVERSRNQQMVNGAWPSRQGHDLRNEQ
jgi:hypothetical protein